jgi:hypothetical protein|tara:strand:- start:269 stop:523 length:255 start_codon:yes stop_codon:yes gene_type:complete
MQNYKALKAASKVFVRKQAVDNIEELQVVKKCYNSDTGEAADDSVKSYTLSEVKREIDQCKSEVIKQQSSQGEWEALETDLKAL